MDRVDKEIIELFHLILQTNKKTKQNKTNTIQENVGSRMNVRNNSCRLSFMYFSNVVHLGIHFLQTRPIESIHFSNVVLVGSNNSKRSGKMARIAPILASGVARNVITNGDL